MTERLLDDDGGIDVDHAALVEADLPRRLFEEHLARRVLPARVRVWEKMADVALAQRAEHRVGDGVKQRVRVRVAVETLGVRNLDAAEDELPPLDEPVNIVADADMIYGASISGPEGALRNLCKRNETERAGSLSTPGPIIQRGF